ncbi:MAG TPA: hypothetical protein VG165_08500 [Solirubrobacteraceae bacterium]|jgi:hypothetical protein|nr:hypothetical protein [Solirubrobacteraceae bacterium]
MSNANDTRVTLRPSTVDDSAEITRLATIDSAPVPVGRLLLAEVDGELRAALGVIDGGVIADPFVPTSALVELLRVRSRSERRREGRSGPSTRRRRKS